MKARSLWLCCKEMRHVDSDSTNRLKFVRRGQYIVQNCKISLVFFFISNQECARAVDQSSISTQLHQLKAKECHTHVSIQMDFVKSGIGSLFRESKKEQKAHTELSAKASKPIFQHYKQAHLLYLNSRAGETSYCEESIAIAFSSKPSRLLSFRWAGRQLASQVDDTYVLVRGNCRAYVSSSHSNS